MDLLQVTRGTVTNWRKEGMPTRSLAGIVRFESDDVMMWLENRASVNKS